MILAVCCAEANSGQIWGIVKLQIKSNQNIRSTVSIKTSNDDLRYNGYVFRFSYDCLGYLPHNHDRFSEPVFCFWDIAEKSFCKPFFSTL